jgi:peptidoglycan LD-endopeptidase CwlK
MPRFGLKSHDQLNTLDPRLQKILIKAIHYVDFSILEGHRTLQRQKELFKSGKSKTMQSKHLSEPSLAVDIAPYPYPDLNNPDPKIIERELRQVYFLVGIIKGIAIENHIDIRLGSDWNRDNDIRNDKFQDAWHLELI